ncbi:hypothetical protein K7640_27480 [Micromonospora sp. PLK6-60]|uniref:hypothetical protein n=1 Tax=Micromonospora sp. PLK6-60 TaxID=2873383 RepID=UPI001CA6DB2A|nr:hypothetical protein [Micromonospora sp. PLK6-60]MBY8875577.1 hypothetical protein [Micromonospora sp. PLK6-60]
MKNWYDSWLGAASLGGLALLVGGACHLLGWWDAAQQAYAVASAALLVRLAVLFGRHLRGRRNSQRPGSRRVVAAWFAGALLAFVAMFPVLGQTGDDLGGVLVLLAVAVVFLGCLGLALVEAQRVERDRPTSH